MNQNPGIFGKKVGFTQIFTDDGKVRSFVNVYLNDEDVRYLGKDATPASDADAISLVPAIAGGAAWLLVSGRSTSTPRRSIRPCS